MAIHVRTGRARVKGAGLVLGLALLGASSAARADYSYTFTLTPLSGNGAYASGTFTLEDIPNTSIALFTSVDANVYFGTGYYIVDQVIQGSNIQAAPIGIGAIFLGSNSSSLAISGTPTVTNSEIKGSVNTIIGTSTNSYYDGASFFDAILSSNSGNGSSGGAPTPEVNAALGLAIAGATVAFLRRRRGGRSGAAAAR
jgi:hypothetical protein